MHKVQVFTGFLLFLFIASCGDHLEELTLESPDHRLQFRFFIDEGSAARYDIYYKDSLIITNSLMGLELKDEGSSGHNVRVSSFRDGSENGSWKPLYGERAEIPDVYNSLVIDLEDVETGLKKMSLIVRAYDEGLAFRYQLAREKGLRVLKENTEFSFANEVNAWVAYNAQGLIYKISLDEIKEEFERPLLVEMDMNTYVALGEAGLKDFARMKFKADPLPHHSLLCALSSEVEVESELLSPWRYIMVAESPGRILENNYLLLNLNTPNKIDDTSWIRPGKVIREVTLTTVGGRACVDFAAKYNLQFVEFDAGWYGNEYNETSDATSITVDAKRSPGPLDLHKVIEYANSKGIGIILYVNRRSLEKQLDDILPLFRSWGIAGVKYGFVNVGSQYWTTWLHEAVKKAADHELMIDIHDQYRPTGYSRTYPNLMTQEGIRGDEESTPNEMVINTLFTRMIAGAGDQTNCYFAGRVTEKMGSHGSQMAKSICIYSPWQFLFWYDRPGGSPGNKGGAGGAENSIPDIPDLQFYAQLPTVWDQTRVLEGYPGEYAVIARKSGDQWFIGALNGTDDRQFNIDLDFLDGDKTYRAVIYSDDALMGTRTNVNIDNIEVGPQSVVSRKILERNGLAMIISPHNN